MPRSLPQATTLQQAVLRVIEGNKADGYTPTRFIQMTGGGYREDLLAICKGLILSQDALDHLTEVFQKDPTPYLTLEDYVSRFGGAWGFDREEVETAAARVIVFDQLVGSRRYS